ncbi:hypothetical protein Tco_1294766 [Tanacetum coccineum]
MECGMAAHLMTILKKSSLHEEFHKVDHHEKFDTCEPVRSAGLRAATAGPGKTTLDSSHHSGTNVAEAEVDSLVKSFVPIMTTVTTITSTVDPTSVTKEKPVKPSLSCADSSSAGGTDPNADVFSDLTSSDFLVGAIRTVINPDTDLQKICFFAYVRRMEHDQLFTEFNVGATCQMSLSVEVRMCVEYNVKEKRRLKSVVKRHGELLKVREEEIENLKAHLLLREAEAIRLCAEASNFETVEKSLRDEMNALKERNAILEKERNDLDVKVTELETSAAGKERELTDLNALITSVKSQNDTLVDRKVTVYQNCMEQLEKFQDDQMKVVNDKWLLTQGMELAIIKCLNSPEYLSTLGAAIGKAIEKVDYDSALQQLQNVNFPLLAELKSNKDASIETVMDILSLEGPLVEKLGLDELQPNVDQLMVPIHHSLDKVVIGVTALSLALDVSSVWPFSVAVLIGTEGTSDIVSATADTTMALSTTFAYTSSIAPMSVDDYEVIDADDQAVADGNAASFSNVDDAELNFVQ